MFHNRLFPFAMLLALVAPFAFAAPAQASHIDVSASGSVFTVTGSGFPPSTPVRIHVTNPYTLVSRSFVTTSTARGKIKVRQPIPGLPSGTLLHFVATTDGVNWSNTVKMTSP
jgi:hypothetical protein